MDTIGDQSGEAEESSVITRRATVLAAVKMAMCSVSQVFWAGAVRLARAVWAGMLRLSQVVRAGALWSLTRAAALFDTLGPRLYFAMTAHGSITYRIEFTSPDHFDWIRSALQSAGWQVDQTDWSGKSTIIAYKTGPHTLTSGYADRAIKSVTLTLSSIPNKVKTIHPEFIHPDIEPHPRWALDLNNSGVPVSAALLRRTPAVYGDRNSSNFIWSELAPGGLVVPDNRTARDHAQRPLGRSVDKGLWPLLIVWATASAVFAFFAFDFLKEIPVVGPAFLAAEPSALQSLVFVAMIVPIVGIECLRIALLSVWFWLWKIWKSETGLNYGMIWFRKLAKTESAKVQAQRRSWPVNQPDRGLKFFGQIGYLAWALTLLLLVPIAVIASVGGIRSLVISAGQDLPMFFAAVAVVALIFIAAALFDLTRLMNVKRLPRAVLSIGTVVLVFSLILKIPVWVYLEGLGVPQLADDVEWTGSVSLAMPLLVAGLVVGALVALCVLVTRRSGFPSGFMVLTICVLAMTALVSILGSIQQSGRGLLEDGTANHAQGSFPGAACIGLVQETSMKPVWVISIKNSLLTTVPRSPTGEPNDVAGSVSQHPLKDYRIVYVSSTPAANTATGPCGSG